MTKIPLFHTHLYRRFTGLLIFILVAGCAGTLDGPESTEMVKVPAGSFLMGLEIENENHWGDTDEEQVHEVYLDSYWIDRYEVTAADFAEFLNRHLKVC